jgi:RNA polymerase sigma-70 factor (ECF subfamily)
MSRGGSISSYHLEASVAFLHCSAKDFRSTDWHSICNLYTTLLQMNANPFAELNYTIALYYSDHKQRAFQKLTILQQHPFLNQYYLLSATLGKFHFLEGNFQVAKEFFHKTITQTNSQVEKDYIRSMICKVDEAEKLSMVRSLS